MALDGSGEEELLPFAPSELPAGSFDLGGVQHQRYVFSVFAQVNSGAATRAPPPPWRRAHAPSMIAHPRRRDEASVRRRAAVVVLCELRGSVFVPIAA